MSAGSTNASALSRLQIEADGGSRGNPGPAAYGSVVRNPDTHEVLAAEGTTIGEDTNNVAEYRGLIAALTLAREINPDAFLRRDLIPNSSLSKCLDDGRSSTSACANW